MNKYKIFDLARSVSLLMPASWLFNENKDPATSLWAEIKGSQNMVIVFRERVDEPGKLLIYGRRPPILDCSAGAIKRATKTCMRSHIPYIHANLNDDPKVLAEKIIRKLIPAYHCFFVKNYPAIKPKETTAV